MTDNRFVNRSELLGILVLAVFLVVILPLCLDVFRLNLVAKYLTYAFVALGLASHGFEVVRRASPTWLPARNAV